jgi:hypothetical protein
MRVVIMPFVKDNQGTEILPAFRQVLEVAGPLPPSQSIGCQLFLSSDINTVKIISTQGERFFIEGSRMLSRLTKGELDKMKFYDVPDPEKVDSIAEEAHNMPTELFVLIQNRLDPDYLFLPEISHFFFRYPHPLALEEPDSTGFGFVQISAYLLDNRENKLITKGTGAGLVKFSLPQEQLVDENLVIDLSRQMQTMLAAGNLAVKDLLAKMKMI